MPKPKVSTLGRSLQNRFSNAVLRHFSAMPSVREANTSSNAFSSFLVLPLTSYDLFGLIVFLFTVFGFVPALVGSTAASVSVAPHQGEGRDEGAPLAIAAAGAEGEGAATSPPSFLWSFFVFPLWSLRLDRSTTHQQRNALRCRLPVTAAAATQKQHQHSGGSPESGGGGGDGRDGGSITSSSALSSQRDFVVSFKVARRLLRESEDMLRTLSDAEEEREIKGGGEENSRRTHDPRGSSMKASNVNSSSVSSFLPSSSSSSSSSAAQSVSRRFQHVAKRLRRLKERIDAYQQATRKTRTSIGGGGEEVTTGDTIGGDVDEGRHEDEKDLTEAFAYGDANNGDSVANSVEAFLNAAIADLSRFAKLEKEVIQYLMSDREEGKYIIKWFKREKRELTNDEADFLSNSPLSSSLLSSSSPSSSSQKHLLIDALVRRKRLGVQSILTLRDNQGFVLSSPRFYSEADAMAFFEGLPVDLMLASSSAASSPNSNADSSLKNLLKLVQEQHSQNKQKLGAAGPLSSSSDLSSASSSFVIVSPFSDSRNNDFARKLLMFDGRQWLVVKESGGGQWLSLIPNNGGSKM